MRGMIPVAVLLAAACAVDVDKGLPDGAQLSCVGDGDCPSEMACEVGVCCACPGNVACLDQTPCAPCTVDSATGCMPEHWCRNVGGEPTCSQFYQPDGGTCAFDYQCVSHHCSGGICCAGGDCCNGSTVNCPAPATVCRECGAFDQSPICNSVTFTCEVTEQPGSDALCDGQGCTNPGGWCAPTCLWWDCQPTCVSGSCGANCWNTGVECFDC